MKVKELNNITSTLNVLYVEDDITLREQNSEFFQQLFQTIMIATDGEEAWKLYQKNNFDIVITDINIPKINGFSLIRLMQKQNEEQKFLITTVYKKEELQDQLKELDLKYFLTKPISTKELLNMIENIIQEIAVTSS